MLKLQLISNLSDCENEVRRSTKYNAAISHSVINVELNHGAEIGFSS